MDFLSYKQETSVAKIYETRSKVYIWRDDMRKVEKEAVNHILENFLFFPEALLGVNILLESIKITNNVIQTFIGEAIKCN